MRQKGKLTLFGKVIRRIRVDHDMCILDMAEKLGVTCAYASNIEFGRLRLNRDYLENIIQNAEFSDAENEELRRAALSMDDYEPIFKKQKKDNKQLIEELTKNINKLSPDDLEQIKKILNKKE